MKSVYITGSQKNKDQNALTFQMQAGSFENLTRVPFLVSDTQIDEPKMAPAIESQSRVQSSAIIPP